VADYPEHERLRGGFTPAWDGLRNNYWKGRTREAEEAIGAFLELATVKTIYTERPGAKQVQLDLSYDYRTNVALYPHMIAASLIATW
jgi:hypothetical protein